MLVYFRPARLVKRETQHLDAIGPRAAIDLRGHAARPNGCRAWYVPGVCHRRGVAAIALIYYKAGVLSAPSAAGPLPPSLCWPCLPSFFHLSLLVTFLLVAALATITFGHDDQSLHSFLNDGDDLEGIEMALASSPPIPHPSSHDRHRSQRGRLHLLVVHRPNPHTHLPTRPHQGVVLWADTVL